MLPASKIDFQWSGLDVDKTSKHFTELSFFLISSLFNIAVIQDNKILLNIIINGAFVTIR